MHTQPQKPNETLGPYFGPFEDDADLNKALRNWTRAMIQRVKNATPPKQLI